MKLRPPAIPLITVDPYFSVWSSSDRLYDSVPVHWTDSPDTMIGYVYIDGEKFRFLGKGNEPYINQTGFDMDALYTSYQFENEKIRLFVDFYAPLFADDLYLLSRPVSYLRISYSSVDGDTHKVRINLNISEEICINLKNDKAVETCISNIKNMPCGKMGSRDQKILSRSGDDLRIDWGYFYLVGPSGGEITAEEINGMTFLCASSDIEENEYSVFMFAYDDIKSINYFGYFADAYWKTVNEDIESVIADAADVDNKLFGRCVEYSEKLRNKAIDCGGEKYADLIGLAYRQIIASHKLAVDEKGNIIYISKECFSNGCAATVDVSYPSSPFFLLFNTELLKGMLRPIFKFSYSTEWQFDFAPHDVGQYPLLLGQVYGKDEKHPENYEKYQMPVEECGNILIMMANICFADKNTKFFDKYRDLLDKWVKYLEKYGMDPENQLCTDDFAGHLAHNCNLSLKAIMGIAGYALVLKMRKETDLYEKYISEARNMAANWIETAANTDGSFRLAFDRPGTFSMKYNIVWDKFWGTELFPPCVYYSEFSSNLKHFNAYGMPLDNRKTYTKSDWMVWTACLGADKDEFEKFIEPLWECFNSSPSRVPMTDWFDTVTSLMVGFRHRSVQGGLYIKMIENLFR